MRFGLPLLLALLTTAAPARACLNDRYTASAEQEFRSRYEHGPITAPVVIPPVHTPDTELPLERHWRLQGFVEGIAGLAMMGLAVQITRRRESAKRRAP